MKNLTKKEMMDIKGGGLSLGTIALIVLGVTFVSGIIDGFIRPFRCN